MKFTRPLIEGIFQKRYKRFFADVIVSGRTEVAHVANTGSLKGANQPGQACLLLPSDNPERKLKFTLQAIHSADSATWIGVDTSNPNRLVREAFEAKAISHWKQWETLLSEVKINPQSRIDFLFQSGERKHYVEVKNVTMAEKGVALFPDAETERGQKHLRELMELKRLGHSAEILFTVQREDCNEFRPADQIDPEYGRLLREAAKMGVQISAHVVKLSPHEIVLTDQQLKVNLEISK